MPPRGGTSCCAVRPTGRLTKHVVWVAALRSEISNNGGDVQAALTTAVPLADKRYTAKSKDDRDWSALFTGSCLISAYVDKRQMTLVCGNCGCVSFAPALVVCLHGWLASRSPFLNRDELFVRGLCGRGR
eukprot:COSAG01_NODE_463_length_16671_cov_192.938209_6_plen_130_part_00